MSDHELVAQEIVKRLFVDLRDRKLLKWFFPPADEYDPDFFIGDITVKPITPEGQEEIAAAWRQIVLAALAKAGRLASEVKGDAVALREMERNAAHWKNECRELRTELRIRTQTQNELTAASLSHQERIEELEAENQRLRAEVAALRTTLGQTVTTPAEPIGCPMPGACSCPSAADRDAFVAAFPDATRVVT